MFVRIIRFLGIVIELEFKMFLEEELEDYFDDILDG